MEERQFTCHCSTERCLHKVPLFASLNDASLESLTDKMSHRVYQKGEILVMEGQQPLGFTVIHSGSAKAYRTTSDGKEQILYIFPAHDYFGARFLFTEDEVPYCVEALEETHVCILSKQQLKDILIEHPKVALELIEAMAKRMKRLELLMQQSGKKKAEIRIAAILLEFAETYGTQENGRTVVNLPLSQEGIANYVGVARETLSRKLSQLEEEKIVEFTERLQMVVLDTEKLIALSSGEYELNV
ncbi:MAG: Crp/Fnr family transcriptional regulator [Sphaerochaetaceae bacterium]|nr:Crp/Fnr family transcriptional regulator [Sphaerochaetaceae bacterium]